jgi:uncharacterized protein (TIGR00369 family)
MEFMVSWCAWNHGGNQALSGLPGYSSGWVLSMNTEHYRKLERMYASAPINEFYAPSLTVSNSEAELTCEVSAKHHHSAGAMHGSVYFKMLDDAAFFAVNSEVEDVFVLTTSFNIYLTRPVESGLIKALGRIVSRSKQVFIAEAVLFDEQSREVGRGSGSFMRSKRKLSPEIGYL